MSDIVKPNGDNTVQMPTKAQIEAVQKKISEAMNDERLQQFASGIILGNQLYAWSIMFLGNEPGHETEVLTTMIDAIQRSMIDENDVPRPFAEEDLISNLEELLPFMKAEVKKHAAQRDAINKMTEGMISEAAAQAVNDKARAKENEENSESE